MAKEWKIQVDAISDRVHGMSRNTVAGYCYVADTPEHGLRRDNG
jgi:hypothetical protein